MVNCFNLMDVTEKNTLPPELSEHFSSFGPCVFDGSSGEPIGWGYAPKGRLGDQLFDEARKYGSWECVGGAYNSSWFLVVDKLTPKLAKEKYGDVTKIEVGPRGGFRAVEYGGRRFIVKELDPRGALSYKPEIEVVV